MEVYTDGSAKGNGTANSVGGWAYAIVSDKDVLLYDDRGGALDTTNQRMELTAAIEGITRALVKREDKEQITVYSDSAYLINCVAQKWWINWLKNGWVNSKKQPVANRDLWEKLIPFFRNEEIKWEKVKGHANNYWNNYVDGSAQEYAEGLK